MASKVLLELLLLVLDEIFTERFLNKKS